MTNSQVLSIAFLKSLAILTVIKVDKCRGEESDSSGLSAGSQQPSGRVKEKGIISLLETVKLDFESQRLEHMRSTLAWML